MKPIVIFSILLLQLVPCPLLAEEAKPHSIGKSELYWLLNRATVYGDDIGTTMLLEAGADPNGWEDYKEFRKKFGFEPSWPINNASREGHTKVVQILLEAGARVDSPEGEGYTALVLATMNNHLETVKVLADAGADLNFRFGNYTALDIANKQGFSDIAAFLSQRQAEQDNATINPQPPE